MKDNKSSVQTKKALKTMLGVKYRRFQWKAWESFKVSAIAKEKKRLLLHFSQFIVEATKNQHLMTDLSRWFLDNLIDTTSQVMIAYITNLAVCMNGIIPKIVKMEVEKDEKSSQNQLRSIHVL